MILNGTEDLRVRRTIESIKQSFEEMICEMNYEDITVKELCDRARINKKTFYYYYPSLDDLTAELQSVMSQSYLEKIADYKIPDDLDKINREFFLFSASQGEMYEKITCSSRYNMIRNKMIDNVMASTWEKVSLIKLLDKPKRNILLRFIQTVSVEIYCQWVADGKKIPLEQVIELSNQLLCSGVNRFIECNAPI